MDYITSWITEIILLILLAVVLEMLLPNSNMQRYVRMVVGLLLLLALLSPVLSIFNTEVEEVFMAAQSSSVITEKALKKSTKSNKSEIQDSQLAYYEEQMAVQMKNNVKGEIHERFNMKVAGIQVVLTTLEKNPEQMKIQRVHVQLSTDSQQSQIVEPVEPVIINMEDSAKEKAADDAENNESTYPEIVSFLESKWGLSDEQLTVEMEGGDAINNEQ